MPNSSSNSGSILVIPRLKRLIASLASTPNAAEIPLAALPIFSTVPAPNPAAVICAVAFIAS